MRTRNPNADSYVCHFDYNCRGTLMQYNIGYDIDGGLVELICASEYNGHFKLTLLHDIILVLMWDSVIQKTLQVFSFQVMLMVDMYITIR